MFATAEAPALNAFAIGIANAIRHDQQVARMLAQQPVGLDDERLNVAGIPQHLIDADTLAEPCRLNGSPWLTRYTFRC